jgi:hypothetical protein
MSIPYMYHRICDSVVELHIHYVLTKLPSIVNVVLHTRLIHMCKLRDDSVPLFIGMVILIRLTYTRIKFLASETSPY